MHLQQKFLIVFAGKNVLVLAGVEDVSGSDVHLIFAQ